MNSTHYTRTALKWLGAGIGCGTLVYGVYAGMTWFRSGKVRHADGKDADPLVDMFMPGFEIRDRHSIRVTAPPELTLSAASDMNFSDCALVRGIFKCREWILRSKADDTPRPRGLVALTKSLGWGLLAELPGREIVMGAVTKPWDANPVFRALPPDEFAAFLEPGYVKILWTLRADPIGNGKSMFRTETRAISTDPEARTKFRRYWSLLSPGIIAIRSAMLPSVKNEAERRWRQTSA